ncbi:hypothetical protein JOM56_011825 [Amanita muscaria]
MSSNVFFCPLPRAQPQPKRGTTTNFTSFPQKNLDRNALFSSQTSNEQSPVTPPRQLGFKTPFGFKSPTPVLFASPSVSQSLPGSTPISIPQKGNGKGGVETLLTPRRPDLGYFAFPPGSPPSFLSSDLNNAAATTDGLNRSSGVSSVHTPAKPKSSSDPGSASTPPCTPPKSRTSNESSTHKLSPSPSRVLEQAEAERGEEEWVSRGGLLRDRFGNVDAARTKKVKEEVERKEREKVLRARWEAYEDGWKRLVKRCGGSGNKGKVKAGRNDAKDVSFNDIPWPVWVEDRTEEKPRFTMSMSIKHSPNGTFSRSQASFISGKKKDNYTLQDLNIDQIEDFLISPLSIRGSTETPKSRVRRSYLRWHPDKLGWLVDRVKEEDVDDVKAGVGTVLECLRRMNAKFRANGGPADSDLLRSQAGTPSSSYSASGSSPPVD